MRNLFASRHGMGFAVVLALLSGCGAGTDAATRLAADIEAGAAQLGARSGDHFRIEHRTPSRAGECTGPYTVQLDTVGALIIWCKDASGQTVSSHSTSYHARFVDTPRTWLLHKPAGETLAIDIERRGSRAVVKDVH